MNILNVNYGLCKGCGICITFCPKTVFEARKDGKPVIVNLEKCIGCNLCVRRCPDFAIKLEVNRNE